VKREWWSGKTDYKSKYGWLSYATIVGNYMQSCVYESVKWNDECEWKVNGYSRVIMLQSNFQRVYNTWTNLNASNNIKQKQARALPVVFRELQKIKENEDMTSGP
jgi:hypothetical protein